MTEKEAWEDRTPGPTVEFPPGCIAETVKVVIDGVPAGSASWDDYDAQWQYRLYDSTCRALGLVPAHTHAFADRDLAALKRKICRRVARMSPDHDPYPETRGTDPEPVQ